MFKHRSAYSLLVILAAFLGVAALIFLSEIGNLIFVVLMISVIGIPVAIALAAIPPLALLFALATLFAWPFRKSGWRAVVLAFIPAAATMFLIPLGLNVLAEKEAHDFVSGEKDESIAPFKGDTLGIFVPPKHAEECLDLCQRVLVSGAAKTFIVARSKKTWPDPDYSAEGTAYWLERKSACEAVKLRDNVSELPRVKDRPSAAPALRLLMAGGNCLVSAKRPVTDADAVLHYAEMTEGRSSRFSFNPFYVPMRATRLSWHVQDGGKFTEVFRNTAVEYSVLFSPLVPGLQGGAELRMYAGLYRLARKLGTPREAIDVEALLRNRLKIDLKFDANAAGEQRDIAIDAALRGGKELTGAEHLLVGDVFAQLGDDGGEINKANVDKAISLLADPRFEIPDQVNRLVRAAYKSDANTRDKALSALFDRLDAISRPVPRERQQARSMSLRLLKHAVDRIPDEDFARNWPRIRTIFADPETTSIFADEIRRARLVGKPAFADLLGLVDAASPLLGDEYKRNKYLHGNRFVAMGVICRMGPIAAGLLPEIDNRLRAGVLPLREPSDLRLAATTLVALGGDPEMIRALAKPDARQKDFDFKIDKAIAEVRKRNHCF